MMTPPPAAIIVFAVGVHFDQLLTDGIDYITVLFSQAAAPDHVARIVEGNRLLEFFSNRDLFVFDQFIIEIDRMHDGYGRHAPSQPAVAHIINRAKRMAAFAHDNPFNL